MNKHNWSEIIYDVYDFLYWEPQHIWKIKNPKNKLDSLDKTMEHIKNIEVSLNQILNIFFYFLPYNLFYKLVENTTNKPIWNDNYILYLKEVENIIDWINGSTQPDFFFIWERANISIEMKTKSKSSLDQLMKYAYLHIKDCERTGSNKDYTLIFLWNWEFKNLWKDKFENVDELKKAFTVYEIADKMKKWDINLVEYKDKIKDLVKNMNIWFLNYTDLKNFCTHNIDNNKSDEKLINLLTWLVDEINERNLS